MPSAAPFELARDQEGRPQLLLAVIGSVRSVALGFPVRDRRDARPISNCRAHVSPAYR